jgi:hypothetical protein
MPNTIRPSPDRPPGAVPPFRWADADPQLRDWLERRTEDIVGFAYRTACDAVRIGVALNEVRARLKHGEYQAWVLAKLPFSLPAARRYRQVADTFAVFQTAQFERFDESALYVLAQDKTPQTARELAVLEARSGKRVTRAVALEILESCRADSGDVGEEELAEYESSARQRNLLTVVREDRKGQLKVSQVDQDREVALRNAQTANRHRRLGKALEAVVEGATLLRVEKLDDPEDVVIYSVTCHRPDDGPRNVPARRLVDALVKLSGASEAKVCQACRKFVPLDLFGDNDREPDELMARCKLCEKGRKSGIRKKKRAERKGAKSEAA